jgi:hypothetical protein
MLLLLLLLIIIIVILLLTGGGFGYRRRGRRCKIENARITPGLPRRDRPIIARQCSSSISWPRF